jgi:hypothetical protein
MSVEMKKKEIIIRTYGMRCGTIFSLILGRIDLRGTGAPACGGQYAPLKPLKYSPAPQFFQRHMRETRFPWK